MKKIFLLLSLSFLSLSIYCAAATKTVGDDENTLDENIRLPMKSVRKHYTTPEEMMLLASNDQNNKKDKKDKKVVTREEAERKAAEMKAAQEAEKARRLAEIEAMDYTIVQYVQPDPEPYKWEDNEEIDASKDSLLALFNVTKVATDGDLQYIHKEVNPSYKENDFYFYFTTTDGVPGPLRFVGHFYADDPIDFVRLSFIMDYFRYEYKPAEIKKFSEGRFYAENFDEAFTLETRDVAAGLAKTTYANMVLVSETGVSHRIFFNADHLRHFRDVYNLYRLMGGKIE